MYVYFYVYDIQNDEKQSRLKFIIKTLCFAYDAFQLYALDAVPDDPVVALAVVLVDEAAVALLVRVHVFPVQGAHQVVL